jgi:Arylsulfotransferase (ASST)
MKLPRLLSVLITLVSILALALVCIPLPGCVYYYDSSKTCDGYTLVCIYNQYWSSQVKLIDMNGNTINTWDLIGFPAKMFPNGSIMGQRGTAVVDIDLPEVVQLSWTGETEWMFNAWDNLNGVMAARAHHDFERDGNPVGYYAPGQEPQAYGGKVLIIGRLNTLDPKISSMTLLDDVTYEVDWDTKAATLVWKPSEHFDEFGFNDEAKQLIYNTGWDYLHINSVSRLGPNKWYDPVTGVGDPRFHPDNLIMDARSANIIWIVNMVQSDKYKVGQIVWKVGPDYSAGTPEGDKLGQIIGQHNAHMIPKGLPGEGNILVLDNGGIAGFPWQFRLNSRILEFDPITLDPVWKYESGNFFTFYSGNAQRLPNGNTLIDECATGRIFEVTPTGETVWECFDGVAGAVYRAYRVPPEWVPGNPSGYKPWSQL